MDVVVGQVDEAEVLGEQDLDLIEVLLPLGEIRSGDMLERTEGIDLPLPPGGVDSPGRGLNRWERPLDSQ